MCVKIEKKYLNAINGVKKIVISTHIHPDADGIGSQSALCMALRYAGYEAICVNEEPLLDRYAYLDPQKTIISYRSYQKKYKDFRPDLFIVVDTNSLVRIGSQLEKIGRSSREILFIDHHPCPKEISTIHCIDTSMAATGELVGKLIRSMKIELTQEMALCLYTSILIDTSSFRYPTVTANTHRLVSQLLDTGIRPPEAYNQIYGTKKSPYLRLLGKVLNSVETSKSGEIAWISLDENILDQYGVDSEDTHGFINNLLILDNIKVGCMFRQIDNQVKISFRSVGDINVAVLAQALGGGGHEHSAATLIDGKLKDVIPHAINKIKMMLEIS